MKTYHAAKGKWPQILAALGFPAEALNGKNQPCPCTGEGKDRFRFADKGRGAYHCHCTDDGNNSGLDLVQCWQGCDFKAAARMVDEVLGRNDFQPSESIHDAEANRRDLRKLWKCSREPGLAVRRYLKRRKLPCVGVRELPRPLAMLAPIYDMEGGTSAHVTYLTEAGEQRECHGTRKRVKPPIRPLHGAHWIPLADTGTHLYVAEGIETALSAIPLFQARAVYALISTHGMQQFVPPRPFERVTILADHDANYAGQAAAYTLAHRLACKGINAEVRVSERADWNDDLCAA